jgi:hypothetical protein
MHRLHEATPDVCLGDSTDGSDNATDVGDSHAESDDFEYFVHQWSQLRTSCSGDELTALLSNSSGSSSACDSATLELCERLTLNTPAHTDVHHTTPPNHAETTWSDESVRTPPHPASQTDARYQHFIM